MAIVNTQQLINTILTASVFVLVFSAWSICVILWGIQYARRQRHVRERLGIDDPSIQQVQALQLWRDECAARGRTDHGRRMTLVMRLEQLQADAGWKSPVYVVLLIVLALGGVVLTAAIMAGLGVWIGLAGMLVVFTAFWVVTERRISTRVGRFERQFVDSLGIAARALRAGHPLVGAFQLIAEEIDDPLGSIFNEICQEQALGLDLKDAIRRAADTNHNEDLKLFATAVTIQMSSGGNLAELMDTLASVMRSRMRLHRRVRVLTAQTQMSKRILIGLPIVLFILLNIIAPTYMQTFFMTWPGRIILAVIIASIGLGTWLMGRLSVLRY